MKTKVCTKCKKEKALSEFGSYNRRGRRQVRPRCRECENEYKKEYRKTHKKQTSKAFKKYYDKNKKKLNESVRQWRKQNPDYRREYMLKNLYDITLKKHEQIYLEQNGCCAICNEPVEYSKIHTDHNHKTGKVRGLLCPYCNHFLAALDNIEFFNKAVAYLDERN